MRTLFGLNYFSGPEDFCRRQQASIDSLASLPDSRVINLQFQDAPDTIPGLELAAELRRDAPGVTGRPGPRKPLTGELFGLLARKAAALGYERFAFLNSDIIVTPRALAAADECRQSNAWVFARTDFDLPGHSRPTVLPYGQDFFMIRTEWWLANERRFRDYILGERIWDNVYTAILLCHANGVLLEEAGCNWHERHPMVEGVSPFGEYLRLLATLDAPYFSLWANFCEARLRARAAGATPAEERELQARCFRWHPSPQAVAFQWLRATNARWRYFWRRSAGPRPNAPTPSSGRV